MSSITRKFLVDGHSVCLQYSKLFLLLLLCGVCYDADAQSPQELYKLGNECYKKNKFDSAIVLYDKLLASNYETAEVHYNIGNALFKTNQLGKSILHYEKALKFAPEDEDVLHNLQLANRKTTDKIISVPELKIIDWWKQFRRIFTSTGWGYLAVGLLWIALAFFALYLFTVFRKLGLTLGVILLLASLFCFAVKLKQQKCETGLDTAILLAKSVYVKSAPDEASTNLFTIHEGLKLQVKDRVGEWCKVRLADGKIGWIRQAEVGII
jgi:tetratricopeptide (TPR) repeat protein